MDYLKYVIAVGILLIVGLLYERLKVRDLLDEERRNYELVKKYFINETSSVSVNKLPIIWIHLDYERNSRYWQSFYSRMTNNLNQPYLNLTMQSIIDKCKNSFNICVINDESFSKLLPKWNVDLSSVSDPIKSKLRDIAIMKVLNVYGGIRMPASVLCKNDLIDLYNYNVSDNKMFVVEMPNRTSTSDMNDLLPSDVIVGSGKNNSKLGEYISYLENLVSTDNTDESNFVGMKGLWLKERINGGEINVVKGKYFGVVDNEERIVNIDRLMSDEDIVFERDLYGVYIPSNEILKRTKYQWFARLSKEQIMDSHNMIGRIISSSL